MATAACNNGSVNFAFVPDRSGPGGGDFATSNAAFISSFTFTDVAYASVSATTLANYDTVVLITCDPMNNLNASQRTAIVTWINNGGKLIIYDSECKSNDTVDYTWLPCQAITYCPGALGADQESDPWVDLWIVEDNTLSSTNATSPYYINTTMIAYDIDAAGDQNVFIAQDPCWCGDMMGINGLDANGIMQAPGTQGYSHAYTHYGNGVIIYNGLDIDAMGTDDDPTETDADGYLTKIWLLELNQTWDNETGLEVCGLPCQAPIPPPEIEAAPTLTPIGLIALVGLLSIIAIATIRIRIKKRR
ncbi:MAG TPA: hypothetical protein VMW40_06875 [Candidatus Bathyarchaeia archaeon]|nr:hypothetical protein [Candidatus Bathyarchaeia archaeon]